MSFIFSILLLSTNGICLNNFNEIWDPESLYEYTKVHFLDDNNPDKSTNLKNMIVDPENYLKNNDISPLIKKMKLLYDKFEINNYIFIISNIKINQHNKTREIDMDKETERFLTKFNYIMYRENNYYEDSMTLMSIIYINEAKIKVRTGIKLRNIIQEKDIINIISPKEIDLLEGKYYKVVNELIDDFHKNYIENYTYYNSFYYKNKTRIFFSIFFIILSSFLIFIYMNYIPKGEREEKIKDFLNQYKDVKYEVLFQNFCVICLYHFMSIKEKLKIENFLDKEKLKKEKIEILECNHFFHKNCIKEWSKREKECPLCFLDKRINKNEIYLKDIITNFVEIQRKFYPHKINKDQCNRIINNFLKENEKKIF